MTASELATVTGAHERYVREWLEQQAVSGLLGLNDVQREAMGREVSAVATDDATLLMLAWAPGRRGPRGASRKDIQAAFPGWKVIGEDAYEKSALPRPLKNVDPRFCRLGRN